MPIDPKAFSPYLLKLLVHLKETGVTSVSWTTVYDGDKLEACNTSYIFEDGSHTSWIDDQCDEALVALAREDLMGDNGTWILNLEINKLYRTGEAYREMRIVETIAAKPEETDLSGLDLRTQAEKDY